MSKSRIPGPAGALLEAQQQGMAPRELSAATGRIWLDGGPEDRSGALRRAVLDDTFRTSAWEKAVKAAGLSSFESRPLLKILIAHAETILADERERVWVGEGEGRRC